MLPPPMNFRTTFENGSAGSPEEKRTTLRMYGPPSGVRVVSIFATFELTTSIRTRWAASPEAVFAIERMSPMLSLPPGGPVTG